MKQPPKDRESRYRITITRVDGGTVNLKPGSQECADFIDAVIEAAMQRPVGFWSSKPWVEHGMRAAIDEVLFSLTSQVIP